MKLVYLLIIALSLVACDDGAGLPGAADATDAGAADTGVIQAVDSQPAVVSVDAESCTAAVTCADGFHRSALSNHYDALGIYACAVDVGVTGSEVANPCGAGEIYGYRSADLVTCRCH
jgi:hypothetical protein